MKRLSFGLAAALVLVSATVFAGDSCIVSGNTNSVPDSVACSPGVALANDVPVATDEADLEGRHFTWSVSNAIVGSYPPNDWGLYDMHGNVQEYCNDWYSANILEYDGRPNISLDNPYCDLEGTERSTSALKRTVLRGGCYAKSATDCRSIHRESSVCVATQGHAYNGFRVICTAGLD